MNKNDGGPAFPQNDAALNRINNHDGMSLRDYFAAVALQGLLADEGAGLEESAEDDAKRAYIYADAMLKARGE